MNNMYKMDHAQASVLLDEYVAAELHPLRYIAVAEHIKECEDCQSYMAEIQHMRTILSTLAVPAVVEATSMNAQGSSLVDAVMAQLAAPPASRVANQDTDEPSAWDLRIAAAAGMPLLPFADEKDLVSEAVATKTHAGEHVVNTVQKAVEPLKLSQGPTVTTTVGQSALLMGTPLWKMVAVIILAVLVVLTSGIFYVANQPKSEPQNKQPIATPKVVTDENKVVDVRDVKIANKPTPTPVPAENVNVPVQTVPANGFINTIKDTAYPIPAGAYFVAPDGKEGNTGRDANSPWPVAKALSAVPAGSTIVFRGGTYRNVKDLVVRKQMTLQPYPHEQVWIKGSQVATDWVREGNVWRKDNVSKLFPRNVKDEYIDPQFPLADHKDMVYVNNISMRQVGSRAEVTDGTFYVDYVGKKIYLGSNPSGKAVEVTDADSALAFWKGKAPYQLSGVVIRGLGFAHYATAALKMGAPFTVLENNTLVWNGVSGVGIYGGTAADPLTTDDVVRGNTFSFNGRRGIGGGLAHRLLFENNVISYNNVEHYATNWDAAGIKVTTSDGMIWRNNLVEHNEATGMWMDITVTNATVVHNIVRNNRSIGIFFEISRGAIIAGNTVVGNGSGIGISHSRDAKIYNNTIVGNSSGIMIKASDRKPQPWEASANANFVTANTQVQNNLLANNKMLLNVSKWPCADLDPMISTLDYNGYYATSSTMTIKWGPVPKTCAVTYQSVEQFRGATGFDKNSLVVSQPTTSFFVNMEQGDYHLQPDSPALKRGKPLPADVANALGWPANATVNIGAF